MFMYIENALIDAVYIPFFAQTLAHLFFSYVFMYHFMWIAAAAAAHLKETQTRRLSIDCGDYNYQCDCEPFATRSQVVRALLMLFVNSGVDVLRRMQHKTDENKSNALSTLVQRARTWSSTSVVISRPNGTTPRWHVAARPCDAATQRNT